MYTHEELERIHKLCFGNREKLAKPQTCGCFFCNRIFPSNELTFVAEQDGSGTAECPFCHIDSVIGEYVGVPVTEELLDALHEQYFKEI